MPPPPGIDYSNLSRIPQPQFVGPAFLKGAPPDWNPELGLKPSFVSDQDYSLAASLLAGGGQQADDMRRFLAALAGQATEQAASQHQEALRRAVMGSEAARNPLTAYRGTMYEPPKKKPRWHQEPGHGAT